MFQLIFTVLMFNCSVNGRRENQHLKIIVEYAVTVLGILHTLSLRNTLFSWVVCLVNEQAKTKHQHSLCHISLFFLTFLQLTEKQRSFQLSALLADVTL